MAPDPIDLAVKRAGQAAAAPSRIAGEITLPSGETARLNLPAPFSFADATALIHLISKLALETPKEETPEQSARKRLVLPS